MQVVYLIRVTMVACDARITAGLVLGRSNAPRWTMAPITDAIVGADLPIGVIDLARSPADLEGKTRGRDPIERDHAIILMSAEVIEDRHAGILAPVEGGAHILERVHFEHEMMEP